MLIHNSLLTLTAGSVSTHVDCYETSIGSSHINKPHFDSHSRHYKRKVKNRLSCNWINWVKSHSNVSLSLRKTLETRNSCGKQIRTRWSSGSSDSSETGFKEKPGSVLRTDLRQEQNCVIDREKFTTQIDYGCQLVDDRVPADHEHHRETDASINRRIAIHQAVRQAYCC